MNTTADIISPTEPRAEQHHETPPPIEQELSKGLASLVNVGRLWASHGLRLGKMGLHTTARTLEVTADTLESLATSFDRGRDEASDPAASE